MNFESDRIYQLIPFGYDQRIPTEQLTNVSGFKTPRHLQKHLELLKTNGAVICSASQGGGGYFRPQTIGELRAYIRTCENRAKNTFRSLKSARQMLRGLEQQRQTASSQGSC